MSNYLKLFRVNHYIKNLLIFFPIFFNSSIFDKNLLINSSIAFVIFCLITSVVYVFNDIADIENDRNHPIKRNRPLASGAISIFSAKMSIIVLLTLIFLIEYLCFYYNVFSDSQVIYSSIIIIIYMFLNFIYSLKLKNKAIFDIMILASGFLIRVLYGGFVTSIEISNWLYLTVLSAALFMALGKRRGELRKNKKKSRPVLKFYSDQYLSQFMYLFLTCTMVFYSLWCSIGNQTSNSLLIYSVLFVIFIIMRYSIIIEKDSYADPIDVILNDKELMLSSILYIVYMGVVIYA